MSTEQWLEKATAYFNGTMTTEEMAGFENETAASDELSQLMQLWKDTDEEAAVYEQYKEDADALTATHRKLKADFIDGQQANEFVTVAKETPVRQLKFSAWKWIAVAAAVTGIIIMVKMLMPSTQKNTPIAQQKINSDSATNIIPQDSAVHLAENKKKKQDTTQTDIQAETLYAQTFKADHIPENTDGPLDNAFVYYDQGQYQNAINAIDNAGSNTSTRGNDSFTPLTNFYATYYKALSLMSLRNTAAAIPLLQQSVLQSPAKKLKIKAQWYLGLAYLKENKIQEANNTFQLLANNPEAGAFKSKAENLLAALNK